MILPETVLVPMEVVVLAVQGDGEAVPPFEFGENYGTMETALVREHLSHLAFGYGF